MSFTEKPETWKRLRHGLQVGMFGYEEADSYIPLLNSASKDASKRMAQHGSDILPYLNLTTFEMIHTVLLGYRPFVVDETKAKESDLKYVSYVYELNQAGGRLQNSPTARIGILNPASNLATPSDLDGWKTFVQHHDYILDAGKTKIEQILNAPPTNLPVTPYVLRIVSDGKLSMDEIVNNAAGLLLGGVDTTANTLLWVLTRLAENPKAQSALRDEIMSVRANPDDDWTAASLKAVRMMQSVIDESMRLAPTASGHMRVTAGPVELHSNRTGKSFSFPPGTRFVFSHPQIRNDPEFVTEPETFNPDRFSRECKRSRKGSTAALALDAPTTDVFSSGPRMCLGARLAKVELKMLLGDILSQYQVSFDLRVESKGYSIVNGFLTRPDPVPKFVFTPVP